MDNDRAEIYDIQLRYCRGVDRGDLALVRSIYHPDAIEHHVGFSGTVDDFMEWLDSYLRQHTGTWHLMGNHMAVIDGDRAVAETYTTGMSWGEPADDPHRNYSWGSRKIDKLERRDGRWGIIERWSVSDWTRSEVGALIPQIAEGPSGSRDAADPLASAMAWLS